MQNRGRFPRWPKSCRVASGEGLRVEVRERRSAKREEGAGRPRQAAYQIEMKSRLPPGVGDAASVRNRILCGALGRSMKTACSPAFGVRFDLSN